MGFAKKPERVNVAFSRAQELLVIVGCHDLFTCKPGTVGSMYSRSVQILSVVMEVLLMFLASAAKPIDDNLKKDIYWTN